MRMQRAAEALWQTLLNVDAGSWQNQSNEWVEQATKARDQYFAVLNENISGPPC